MSIPESVTGTNKGGTYVTGVLARNLSTYIGWIMLITAVAIAPANCSVGTADEDGMADRMHSAHDADWTHREQRSDPCFSCASRNLDRQLLNVVHLVWELTGSGSVQ